MDNNLVALQKIRPDLAKMYLGYYQKMSKEQFLLEACGDVLDLVAMQERVAVFMELCTDNMSYTTYPPETIRSLVSYKQEQDLILFCQELMDDYDNPQDMFDYVKGLAEQKKY